MLDYKMPARPGQKRGDAGLTLSQTKRLEEIVIRDGYGIGVTALHHKLRVEMGADAPTREEIGRWKKAIPSEQIAQMPKATAGVKNVTAPVIPPASPMSRVFADTYFLPASYHMKKGKGKVYRAAILYCDALTKFIHVEPCALLVKDRPMSSVAVSGYKRFIAKCQELSEMEIHPTHLRTDGGAEWKGAFATFMTEQREIHPDAYAHTLTTGGRASSNSIAERSVATIRRLQYAHYRSVVRKWDED